MKIYRIIISIIFAAALVVTGVFFFRERLKTDLTYPTITIDGEELEVSLNPTDEELKTGVTAWDGKDGDLTSSVVVESISKFITKGESTVTYAVCDSNYHVATATRKIIYKDYESPQFTLSAPMLLSVAENRAFSTFVGAEDLIDGDISSKVMINSNYFDSTEEGMYEVDLQVSNSKGDTIKTTLPVEVENITTSDPVITLSKYLIYLNVGESFNPEDYIVAAENVYDQCIFHGKAWANGAKNLDGNIISSTVVGDAAVYTESYVKNNKAGVYYADYYIDDGYGRTGHTRLMVIVQEAEE